MRLGTHIQNQASVAGLYQVPYSPNPVKSILGNFSRGEVRRKEKRKKRRTTEKGKKQDQKIKV